MGTIYLIPSLLHTDAIEAIPAYILTAIKDCQVFFVENERTTRRYFRQLSREIIIDNYEWHNITEEAGVANIFRERIKQGKNIGIVSEAGCPGIADPGQELVAVAQQMKATVKPLVGPNSILLALMASGMNGQQFQFLGYLPIDGQQRIKALKDIEAESARKRCTQIFIETPYRNNQMLEAILKNCRPSTQLCIAKNLTSKEEWVRSNSIEEWKRQVPELHKQPAIFLLLAISDNN